MKNLSDFEMGKRFRENKLVIGFRFNENGIYKSEN